jgi:acetyl-CoA acyltransferase
VSQLGREAVIVEAVRTPVGRGHAEKGIYRDVHPADLLGRCYVAVLERAGVDPAEVDNVLTGCAHQVAQQSTGIARTAWLQKGLPEAAGATTLDIRCGSGQQAVNLAALRIAGGVDEVVVAAGVEHMGRVGFPANEGAQEQWGRAFAPELLARYDLVSQGIGAEMIADRWEITRDEMDELAARSHRLAHEATTTGKFEREILPVEANGTTHVADQGIRPDSSPETLAALKPAFKPDGRVTAGNSSQISDGASALLLMSREKAGELGVRPRAKVLDQVVLGVDPVTMLTGPIPATAKILKRNGLSIGDVDLIEINEAFASVGIQSTKDLGVNPDIVNVNGGAIALGHPIGMSGARLVLTLALELRRRGGGIGAAALCGGGGQGDALIIKVPSAT